MLMLDSICITVNAAASTLSIAAPPDMYIAALLDDQQVRYCSFNVNIAAVLDQQAEDACTSSPGSFKPAFVPHTSMLCAVADACSPTNATMVVCSST